MMYLEILESFVMIHKSVLFVCHSLFSEPKMSKSQFQIFKIF